MKTLTFKKIKQFLILLLAFSFIHLLVVSSFKNIDALIQITTQISMQSFSILMGIIIGAVAILIGSITGLYGLLLNIFHNKVEKGTSSEVGKIEAESTEINSLNKSVNCQNNDNEVSRYLNDIVLEIKDNVLWLIKLYALNIILIYGYSIHFSFNLLQLSIYSNYYPFFSMKSIITSLNIFVLFISLYIVFDIVSAIFTIYQTHMLAISEEFKIKN